jgi:hypothetical protein
MLRPLALLLAAFALGGMGPPERPAEVELSGAVVTRLRASRYFVFATPDPCDPRRPRVTRLGMVELLEPWRAGAFMVEIEDPKLDAAHLCAVALDAAGRLVGFGAYRENPVSLQGRGVVQRSGIELPLRRVPPRPAPEGLL